MKKGNSQKAWLHKLVSVTPARHKSLWGRWRGFVWPQYANRTAVEIPVRFGFKNTTAKVIAGEMSFRSPDKTRGLIENYLVGGFLNDAELQFSFAKKKDGVIGWGIILFRLSADASRLDGEIVGLSSHTGDHYFSKITLRKGAKAPLTGLSIKKEGKPTVFIGHGHNKEWRQIKGHLEKRGYEVSTFEARPRAGKTIYEVLTSMMVGSSFALLIMTGEDKTEDGKLRARQNVVHEIGLFQGRLGINRAVVLVEAGVEDFSNIEGITRIEFEKNKVSKKFKEIEDTIKREFPK